MAFLHTVRARISHIRIPRHLVTVALAAAVASVSVWVWPPERLPSPLLKWVDYLEWYGYDAMFLVRGPQNKAVNPNIVVVGYSRDTEKALDMPWPPPRSTHARVINNMVADGAKVVVYDVLFTDASDPAEDKALDAALRNARRVILATSVTRDEFSKRASLNLPYYDEDLGIDFEEAALDLGVAEVPVETDGTVRRMVPVVSFQDEWLPALPAAAYLAYKGLTHEDISVNAREVRLGTLRIPRTGPTVPDPVKTSKHPYWPTVYLDFPTNIRRFSLVPFEQVYNKEFPPGYFRDKVAFVGITGTELAEQTGEQFVTAYSRLNPEALQGRRSKFIPGVMVQASMFNALLNKRFIRLLSGWQLWLLVFGFALVATWCARRFISWQGPALLAVAVAAFLVVTWSVFGSALTYIPWVSPNLLVLTTASLLAWVERESLQLKWAGYVSPAVMQVIMRQEADVGARRHVASVIFGDIRNFTGFSEQHTPETVVRLLNKHLEKLTDIIFQENGTIDKFLGDGILAVFGAPLPLRDHVLRAVRACWKMREASLLPILDDGEEFVLGTGFGVTTGPFVAGHVGSHRRHDFTIIGDTVNLAARLQGVTGKPDVIIDEPTYEIVRDHVEAEPLGGVTLKGKANPVPCFKVTAWNEAGNAIRHGAPRRGAGR